MLEQNRVTADVRKPENAKLNYLANLKQQA